MDLKRYEEITWQEAISKLENGERIFIAQGHSYFMEDGKLCYLNVGQDNEGGRSSLLFNHFMERKWYVKKPFDARKEMLENPGEWIGAFKEGDDWQLLGFDPSSMSAWAVSYFDGIGEPFEFSLKEYHTHRVFVDDIDRCIPIEDVPEEDLQ